MSLMKFAVKHDRTLDEAKEVLESTVRDATKHFSLIINEIHWNTARSDVRIEAKGATIHAWVDAVDVHLECDVPLLSKLLGGPVVEKLKGLVEDRFQKKLTERSSS